MAALDRQYIGYPQLSIVACDGSELYGPCPVYEFSISHFLAMEFVWPSHP